jgi:hypothetical protein
VQCRCFGGSAQSCRDCAVVWPGQMQLHFARTHRPKVVVVVDGVKVGQILRRQGEAMMSD